jgi:peptidoglycan/LPS O-acetylase OafA/YrhL
LVAKKETIDSLTGLRGIAALFVVITHYFVWFAPYDVSTVPPSAQWIFETSDLGLTIFFVLSGFVIFYNYGFYPWDTAPIKSFFRFVYLRICRLYPALILFFLTFIDKFLQIRQTGDLINLVHFLGIHLVFAQTSIPLKYDGALVGNTIFHVSWSLGTEFLMYIVFALSMVIYFKTNSRLFRNLIVIAGATYVCTSIYLAYRPESTIAFFKNHVGNIDLTDGEWIRYFFYLSPYFRFSNFLLGIGAAYLVLNHRQFMTGQSKLFNSISSISFVLLIVFFVLDHRFGLFNSFGHAKTSLLQMVNAILIAAMLMNAVNKNFVNRLFETKILVHVGMVSYSLYLFHYLIPRLGLMLSPDGSYSSGKLIIHLMIMALNAVVAVTVASGLFKTIEVPAKRYLSNLFKQKSTVSMTFT